MSKPGWLGKDEIGGTPSEPRPDRKAPPHWRLDAVYATARPHNLAVSPDGSTIAFVLELEGTTDVWSMGVNSSIRPSRLTTNRGLVAYWEDSPPVWSPDGSRIAFDNDGDVCLVPAAGGPIERLVSGSMGAWIDDQHLVVSVEWKRTSRLAIIDVDDPWPKPIGPSDGDVGHVAVTADGRVLAVYYPKTDFSRSDIVVVEPEGSWTTMVGVPDRRAADHAIGSAHLAYTLEDGDRAAVFVAGLDGSDGRLLAGGDRDFSDLVWLPDDDGLLALATNRGTTDLVRISMDGEVTVIGSGGVWQTPVVTSAGVVAVHEAADSPSRIVILDEKGPGRVLYDGAPALVRAAPHSKIERITYQSEDGLEIEGFLFRPADTSHPVPAVVYPHGGPTDHNGDAWDGHAQYFVDKGYAWLAINFRGSTSYGIEFERANHGDWGVGDVADCVSAAHFLAGLGWVDPKRIGIFGASYGSYMALASLVRVDNPFACGVAKYGDCDILTSWAQGDRAGVEDLERMMGHPSRNREAYRAGSPIHNVRRISAPILIAHGEQDARVHPKQSEELVEALDRIGATYEYVTYPTEGHGFLRRDPHLHFYRRLERFLDWHLM